MTLLASPLQSDEIFPPIDAAELDARFSPSRIEGLSIDLLQEKVLPGPEHRVVNLIELARQQGKRFIVDVSEASLPDLSDVGRSVETTRFADVFERLPIDVYAEYAPYDPASKFITLFDTEAKGTESGIAPVGAIRMIEHQPGIGLKSVNDLVSAGPENPWLADIMKAYFEEGETYDPDLAWARLQQRAGVSLDADRTHDVATIATTGGYGLRGRGLSLILYHTCLRYALGQDKENLVSIQDEKPFALLQRFGKPFEEFGDLGHYPYGGPYDTVPAYSVLAQGMDNIRRSDDTGTNGAMFIDGAGIDQDALLLQHYMPEQYSAETVGLSDLAQAS